MQPSMGSVVPWSNEQCGANKKSRSIILDVDFNGTHRYMSKSSREQKAIECLENEINGWAAILA